MKSYLLWISLVTLICQVVSQCDLSTDAMVEEGNLGQTGVFSWLGVLRVHMHPPGEPPRVALTGVVLIKKAYALVNADDVSKISHRLLTEDSRVMFLPAEDTPWFCPPKSYKTHYEYEYQTINTIGVLELNLNGVTEYPMRPICWPNKMAFNTSTFLYVTGYTDENKLLEKVIYKVKYTEKQACEDFYNKAGLIDKKKKPVHYICGYSEYKSSQCLWDNGMVLVSNATKVFTLIGFAVRGPGCAAPARFLDLQRYYKWVEDSTSLKQEIYDDYLP